MLSDLTFIKLNFKQDILINKSTKVFLRNGTSDLPVFRQIFMDCEYELNLPSSNIKTIIDGGCNVGLASVYFATSFPQSQVIGIEPDESNYRQALKNTASFKQIKVIKAGIWSRDCFLKTVSNMEFGEWGITVEESSEEGHDVIKAITIDSIMEEYNFRTVDILKLDVEGAELEIFKSNYEKWLPKTKIIVIELHDFVKKGCSMQFFKSLSQSGINYNYSMRGENVIIVNEDCDYSGSF